MSQNWFKMLLLDNIEYERLVHGVVLLPKRIKYRRNTSTKTTFKNLVPLSLLESTHRGPAILIYSPTKYQ